MLLLLEGYYYFLLLTLFNQSVYCYTTARRLLVLVQTIGLFESCWSIINTVLGFVLINCNML